MTETECGFQTQSDLVVFGPTISVKIGFNENSGGPFHALIDTGAFESCIDKRVALDLRLPVVDQVEISGASGKHKTTLHLGYIEIPALGSTISGRFAAVDLIDGGQSHHALLGRTFLQHHTMIYKGSTGEVQLIWNKE